MATPMENNTEGLREILQTVQQLPAVTKAKLQEKSVTPAAGAQSVTPDSGYDGLSKVTVAAMPAAAQATPEISVSTSGLITASASQTAGYVQAGTKSATKQLTTQAAQTITPGTTDKTISSGRYLTGNQTIRGDENLVAENIKSGVSIFGVEGTLAAGAVKRVTGTITFESEYMVISLGFVPDIVMFPDFTYPNRNGTIQICSSAAAFFTESVGYSITISARMSDKEYLLYPGLTEQGFYVDGFYRQNGTGWDLVLDMPLNYVAVKYTQ